MIYQTQASPRLKMLDWCCPRANVHLRIGGAYDGWQAILDNFKRHVEA
jgi:hypothetical protein